jgi:hypothetical protein
MTIEQQGPSTLTVALLRAAGGLTLMLLGIGATLCGSLISQDLFLWIGLKGNLPQKFILLPTVIGFAVYFLGALMAGKRWPGVVASVGMGAVVLLVGVYMYVMGLTSEASDWGLTLLRGFMFVVTGIASIAIGATAPWRIDYFDGCK